MSEYEAHSRRMRQIICNAMADLLFEKPFLKITVRDIMDKAEIQRATFYRYFRDKYEVAENVNNNLAAAIAHQYFSSFYLGHGVNADHGAPLAFNHIRILYKMLDLQVENVNLRKNLSDMFIGEYVSAFPDAGEFEAYLAARNFLSVVEWMAQCNASPEEVKRFLQSDAQQRWLARFYNVSPRSFNDFLSDIRNHT
jgi:AcrR family transcriptional regulator